MKNKQTLKISENKSSAWGNLNKASIYFSDLPLFKSLELMPFSDIPANKEYYVGEAKFKNGSVVKIWVFPAPALFWRFEVFVAESNKTTKVSTGSGALENFWEAIKLIAENMLVLESME
jgi:hypothetical protein